MQAAGRDEPTGPSAAALLTCHLSLKNWRHHMPGCLRWAPLADDTRRNSAPTRGAAGRCAHLQRQRVCRLPPAPPVSRGGSSIVPGTVAQTPSLLTGFDARVKDSGFALATGRAFRFCAPSWACCWVGFGAACRKRSPVAGSPPFRSGRGPCCLIPRISW